MKDGTNNLWNTPEAEAWCRDFDYEEYTTLRVAMGTVGAQLTCQGYMDICAMLDAEMERTI